MQILLMAGAGDCVLRRGVRRSDLQACVYHWTIKLQEGIRI
jgi:hypothetical protein